MSSSPWAQWGALLLPRPDPRDFARPRASSSSFVSFNAVHLCPSLSTKSLSLSLSSKSAKKTSSIPSTPPCLDLLAFSTEPIVDLTLPPYQASPTTPATQHDALHGPQDPQPNAEIVNASTRLKYTESYPRNHPTAPEERSGRQNYIKFNNDGSYVTDNSISNLSSPTTSHTPRYTHIDADGQVHPQPNSSYSGPSINSPCPPLSHSYYIHTPTSKIPAAEVLPQQLLPQPPTNLTFLATPRQSSCVEESILIRPTDMLRPKKQSSTPPSINSLNNANSTTPSFTVVNQIAPLRRPPLLPHNVYINPDHPLDPGRRRWTLASAMMDEAVSDVGLVREFERMRAIGAWERVQKMKSAERHQRGQETGQDAVEKSPISEESKGKEKEESVIKDDVSSVLGNDMWNGDIGLEIWDSREEMLDQEEALLSSVPSIILNGVPLVSSPRSIYPPSTSTFPLAPPNHSSWLTAQRALLICRELLLTERHYLALMQTLLEAHTVPPPPPLMLHYVAELVHASEAVLQLMEKRPSVTGIADAFVQHQDELETAYVRWCGVVGGWFIGHNEGTTADGIRERGGGSEAGHVSKKKRTAKDARPFVESYQQGKPPATQLKRTVSTWRKSLPNISSLGPNTVQGGAYVPHGNSSKHEEGTMATPTPTAMPLTAVGKPARKHTVRDLAILPTQRVMRYVLLYRDLLVCTPPSSASHAVVERAIEVACRIADKCNRAQGNAAFILSKPNATRSGSGASSSSRGSAKSQGATSSISHPFSTLTQTASSASPSTSSSNSMSGLTAVTSATSVSSYSHQVIPDKSSGVNDGTERSIAHVPRTSRSAVSLSLTTSTS